MERLKSVIRKNHQIQEHARNLNMRAGKDVFQIMSCAEWREWVEKRLHGARRVAEIANIDVLHLPELDSSLVMQVITDNPDIINIEGVTFNIEYNPGFLGPPRARIKVNEKFARETKIESVILPCGRIVEIICDKHSADTFAELIKKLEYSRIETCWHQARRQYETDWSSDIEKVADWLNMIGEIEITKTANGEGEPIIGFVGIKQYSNCNEWRLFVTKNKEEFDKETSRAFENETLKETAKFFSVKDEEVAV